MKKQNYTLVDLIPGSKSYANRVLIYSYLIGKDINFTNVPKSDDVQNTLKALQAIKSNNKVIDLGEGGTTIRFLMPVICNQNHETLIKVHPRFKNRPYLTFLKSLESLGAKIKLSDKPDELAYVSGPLKSYSKVLVDCRSTTQFYSSFLLIQKSIGLEIETSNLNSSTKYIDLTKKAISDVESKTDIEISVDFSCASYLIAWAYAQKSMFFSQIKQRDPLQADDALLDIITDFKFDNGLYINKVKKIPPLKFDVSECLDLTPTLIFLCLFSDGKSVITGVKNLKYKEVNRLEAIKDILEQVGADFIITENSITIFGNKKLNAVNLNPAPDHRIVMMSALIAKRLNSSVVSNRDCVSKSFPNFWKLIDSI